MRTPSNVAPQPTIGVQNTILDLIGAAKKDTASRACCVLDESVPHDSEPMRVDFEAVDAKYASPWNDR